MRRRLFCQSVLAASLAAPAISRAALASAYAGLTKIDGELDALSLSGAEQTLSQSAVQELADSLRGALLIPGNAGYDVARQVLNPDIDRYPALVVRPTGSADISNAVSFASSNNLVVAVKCGGHSFSGKSTCDGGLLIDLSSFRNVRVDQARHSAFVTGGSLLGEIDHETMAHGLVTPAGTVSHTGVGGLATGGGFGRVARRFGLTLDNIKSVDVVAADGKLHHASADENPELLWAVRGGGGNFGVVTNFEFQLHAIPRQVIGGMLMFPMSKARELAEVYAQYSADCPDELYTDLAIFYPPGNSDGFAGLDVCWSGKPGDYQKVMQPYYAIGEPASDNVKSTDYVALQRSGDTTDPRAMATYLKGGFISRFTPELVKDIIDGLQRDPRRMTMIYFQHSGGAISRVPSDATAFAHRYATHNMLPMVSWAADSERADHVRYHKEYWQLLKSHTHGFYTVEADDQSSGAINRNFQGNYAKLLSVKNRYDPHNIFRLNANIRPTV